MSRSANLTITLERGYVAGDADALVDWLFRTGWSVSGRAANGGVLVSVEDANGDPLAWEYWSAALEKFGLPQSTNLAANQSDYELTGIVSATTEELEKLIGPWPGDIPEFTDNLIVEG